MGMDVTLIPLPTLGEPPPTSEPQPRRAFLAVSWMEIEGIIAV